MSLAALIRSMASAGAPPEAIALAVEALEAITAEAERVRLLARERKRRQRSRDGHVTVTGRERDGHADGGAFPPDKNPPQTPQEITPLTPTVDADASTVPPAGVDGADEGNRDGEGQASADDEQATGKARTQRKGPRQPGSRIADDWAPPPVDELPLEYQAMVRQWPAGGYEIAAETFRNHWLAEGRAIGAKRNWPRTWLNWVYRENTTMIRAKKAGVAFTVSRPAGGGTAREAEAARREATATEALQAAEAAPVKALREALRREFGERTYHGWLRPTVIALAGDAASGWTATVRSTSQFLLDWVKNNFEDRIAVGLRAELGGRVDLRWEVRRPVPVDTS